MRNERAEKTMIASFNWRTLGSEPSTSKNNLHLFHNGAVCNRALGVVKKSVAESHSDRSEGFHINLIRVVPCNLGML